MDVMALGNLRDLLTREGRNGGVRIYFLCEGKVDMVTIDKGKCVCVVTYLTFIKSQGS